MALLQQKKIVCRRLLKSLKNEGLILQTLSVKLLQVLANVLALLWNKEVSMEGNSMRELLFHEFDLILPNLDIDDLIVGFFDAVSILINTETDPLLKAQYFLHLMQKRHSCLLHK